MAEKKKGNKWNLAELQETLVKDTEHKIEQGFKEIADTKGSGAHAEQQSVYQEPTQNINIPIPTSQHTRLKVISATSRQTMKDMVVQAIGLWLDVQEGKIEIKK